MSHIINPERRDPSAIKNKSELGLSRVDNISSKDLLRSTFEYLKEEYWRGEKYSFTNERSLFPLCKFTSDSTRLSVLIGFYRDSNALNLVSYVKADIVYDRNYTNQSSNEYGNGLLTISFEKSPNLVALGEFILYKESSSNNTAYLGFNFLSIASEYQLSICVNEYPIYGEGLVFSPSIELCDKTPRKKPSDSNIIESISINSTDRTVSSMSRSLAVYDNNGKLYHGELSKTSGIPSGYTTPKINGTPFTGDGGYREIEITALHPGSDLSEAGYHNWEVLRNIPTVSFRGGGRPAVNNYYDADDVKDEKYGLCKLARVPSLSSGVDKNNLGSAISDLTSLVENSEISDSDVISSKFLKTYTKQLERIFQIISTFGGGGTDKEDITTTYYFHNSSNEDDKIISNPASNAISRLDLYPTASQSVDYKILIQTRMKKMTLVCSDSEIKLDGGDWLYTASIDTQNNSSSSEQSQGYTMRASTFDMREASTTTVNPSTASTTKSPDQPPSGGDDETNTVPPTDSGGSGSGGSDSSGGGSGGSDGSGSGSGDSSNPYPTDFKVNKFSLRLRSNLVYHRYTLEGSPYLNGTLGITSDSGEVYGKIKVGIPFNNNSIFHKEYTSGSTEYEVVQPIVISRVGYSDQANSLPTNTITWISGYDFVTYDSSSNSGFIHSPLDYSTAPTYELVLPPPEDSSSVTNKYLWVEGFSILNFKTEKSNLSEGIYIYRGNGTNTVISDEQNLLDSNTSLGYKDITKSNKSSSSLTAEQKNHRFLIRIDLTEKRSYYDSNREVVKPTDSDYEYNFTPNKNNHVIGNLIFKDCTTQTTNATIQLKYRQRALKLPVPSSDIVLNICYEDITKAMNESTNLVGEPILTNIEGLSVVLNLNSGINTKVPVAGGSSTSTGLLSFSCSRWSLDLDLTSTRDFNFPITSESEWKEYESFNNKELSLSYTCPKLPLYQQTSDGYKELDPLSPQTVKVPLKYRSTFSGGRSPLYFNKFTLSGLTPISVLLGFPTEGTSGQAAAEINFWEPSDFLYKEKHGYKNYPSQLLSEGSTVSKIPIARRTKIGDIQFSVHSVGKYYYDSSQNESSKVVVEYIIAPARKKIFIIYGLISDWGTITNTSAFITENCFFSPQLGSLTDSNVEFNISASSNNSYSIITESINQGCIPFKSRVKAKATAYSNAPADVKEDLAIISTISNKNSIQYTKEYIEFSLTSKGSDQPVYVSKDSDGAYTNKIRYDIYYVWWSKYTVSSTGGVIGDASLKPLPEDNAAATDWQDPSLDPNSGLTAGLTGAVPEVGTGSNKPTLNPGGFVKPGNVGLSSSY